MTDEAAKHLADAINRLASAIQLMPRSIAVAARRTQTWKEQMAVMDAWVAHTARAGHGAETGSAN